MESGFPLIMALHASGSTAKQRDVVYAAGWPPRQSHAHLASTNLEAPMNKRARLPETNGDQLRELCRPDGESHEDSIRIALEAAGIQGSYRRSLQFGDSARVYVRQQDYDRAKQAISELQSTPVFNAPGNKYVRIILHAFALSVAVFVLREIWLMMSR